MGTHPIFESDFDCLTEMSGKLYTYPDNFRADKIRAVANISGYNLSVAPEYVHGVTNKTEEFQAKFFGKVPAFESGETCLCDDTAIAHFVGNAQTRGGDSTHDVFAGPVSPKVTSFPPSRNGFGQHLALCSQTR